MNLRPILVSHARLAAFVLLIECVTFWPWSKWIWTPIQAHYMVAYLWSSLPGKAPDSVLQIRWIWKTAQGGKRELAIEDDAVRVSSSEQAQTGMHLSQAAQEAGWTGLAEGPPERIPRAQLRAILSDQIFEGQSVWLFVLLPGMIGFVAAIFLLQCFMWLEDWLPELPWRRERFPWEKPVPTFLDRCTVWLKKVPSSVVRLRRVANQSTGTHSDVSTAASPEEQAPEKPKSLALPVFAVHDGSNARVYVWSERDEID